ncbi:hypothetical protein [Streptomyces sp. E5N91]|uniref:ComEC/Rec2 family competence protein n=1 Tax=Streptomyces sp. E5N91 TaxID=1851996 RepID=UPI000EF5FE5E|nr:hypothetical protein [Streptomyces sp. E5N91]
MPNASLEIHVINVSQGDSILVVNRDMDKLRQKVSTLSGAPSEPMDFLPFSDKKNLDLYGTVTQALLIDGGDECYGPSVVDYLRGVGVLPANPAGPDPVYVRELAVLMSHHHSDHVAGLRAVHQKAVPKPPPQPTAVKKNKKKGSQKKTVLPQVTWQEYYRPGAVYRPEDDSRKLTDRESYYRLLLRYLAEASSAKPPTPTEVHMLSPGGLTLGAPTTINLGDAGTGNNRLPITVHVLGSAQGIWDATNNKLVTIDNRVLDQNDRSVILMVEYGSFRFFTAGDIGGNGQAAGGNTGNNAASPANKKWFSVHGDVETKLGPLLEERFPATTATKGSPKQQSSGCCTVLKVSHHGSNSSTDVHFLATLRPEIALISSGLRPRFYHHPTQEVMNRLDHKKQSPSWQIRGSNPPAATPNTICGVYVTEIADLVDGNPFPLDRWDAKVVGDIVVRPTDESVWAVQNAQAAQLEELEVWVHGSRVPTEDTTAINTVCTPDTDPTKGAYYAYGPDKFKVPRH